MAIKFAKLTRAAIKALEPGKSLNEHGITATKLRTGDVRYGVNLMVDGQRIHRAIGLESAGVRREQCEVAIANFQTKAREGRLDLPPGRKSHPTFAELAPAYIIRLEESGGRNMAAKRQHVGQFFVPFFGPHRMDRITTSTVEDYVRRRLGRGLKQSTVNRELASLSHLFRRMVKWGWIRAEHVPELRKGPESRKNIIILSDADADNLMKAAVADQDPYLWLFVACGLNTAMRHSEILRIRFAHVNTNLRRIFVPEAKAGERHQPITPALTAMLEQQQQQQTDGKNNDWVFPCLWIGVEKGPR